MSLTKKDRKVRSSSGRSFPAGRKSDDDRFAVVIAAALKRDFGDGATAVRKVAKLVRVNERAAKNWLSAKNAPNGAFLVRLIEHSDGVLESILALAHRDALLEAKRLDDTRKRLRAMQAEIDAILAGGPHLPVDTS